MSNSEHIVHLCPRSTWQAAQVQGSYQADTLAQSGFIHFSRPEQILRTANAFYQDMPDPVLLWVDSTRLRSELRWERNADGLFPHLYGPLNLDAVILVTELIPDPDGVYRQLHGPK